MERKGCWLIIILLIFLLPGVAGAGVIVADERKEVIYQAYISGEMIPWKNTIDRLHGITPKSNDLLLDLINYQYGYIAWCIGNNRREEAEYYLRLAEENLELLKEKEQNLSTYYSYQAAFNGFRMGLNAARAPFLGPKSVRQASLSMSHDPSNPFGYIQYGHSEYYMPAIFGGSKKTAIAYYLEAERLMEKDKRGVERNWNYLNLLTSIAIAYQETGQMEDARRYYEKILRFEPAYLWVKDELYPEFLSRMNE